MKAFLVTLSISAVVMAESASDAQTIAEQCSRDIVRDSGEDFSTEIDYEIKCLKGLPMDWDGNCIPYGGNGEIRLRDLLPEEPPFVDTKTIDMFKGAKA